MDGSRMRGKHLNTLIHLVILKDGQVLLYQVPPLSKRGLLLALAGTKEAPLGMMRTKVLVFKQYILISRLN